MSQGRSSPQVGQADVDERPTLRAIAGTGPGRAPSLSPIREEAARFRAEAERWARVAAQMSLAADRDYFMDLVRELRARAAALETPGGVGSAS